MNKNNRSWHVSKRQQGATLVNNRQKKFKFNKSTASAEISNRVELTLKMPIHAQASRY